MDQYSTSIYFIPSKTEGRQQAHAKGKLIERWKNVARRLRSVGAIACERKSQLETQTSTFLSTTFSEEVYSAKLWLQIDGLNSNIDLIKEKWSLTYEIRRNEIFGCSLLDIFKKWPLFQSPNGYKLVDEDFKIGNPITHALYDDWNTFLSSWKYFSQFLVTIRKSSVKDKDAKELLIQLDSSDQIGDLRTSNIIRILLIPYLIPTKTQIKINNKFWKPSLEESSSAFATHTTNIVSFHADFTLRQDKYLQWGATIQPFITFVGEDVNTISSSIVCDIKICIIIGILFYKYLFIYNNVCCVLCNL